MGEGGGREVKREGICKHIADSHRCTAETNYKISFYNYMRINKNKKQKKEKGKNKLYKRFRKSKDCELP